MARIIEWRGLFTFNYANSARGLQNNGADTFVDLQHSGSISVRFTKPNPGQNPTSWEDKEITGPGRVNDTLIEDPNSDPLVWAIVGDRNALPARNPTLDTHAYFNIDPKDCHYNFQVGTRHPAILTAFGESGDASPLFAYRLCQH